MQSNKGNRISLTAIIMVFALIFSSCGFFAYADDLIQNTLTETKVSGICTYFNKNTSKSIKDAVTVSPSRNGVLKLQYYNESSEKWVTKAEYTLTLTDSSKEKIVIEYPSLWKKSASTTWRIYIPESDSCASYISDEIQIFSKNIKTLELNSKSVIIMRADNQAVIYGKKIHTSRANASTTKIMTALLCLENADFSSTVKISKNAASTPYGYLNASAGDKYYVKDLFNAMLVVSSNDCATALAESIGGSVSAFAKMMNKKAKELSCDDTHFVNAHGLNNKNHYTSAYDLSVIHIEALKYSAYRKAIARKSYSFKDVSKTKKYNFKTTDTLLSENYTGFIGGKTGYTKQAGYCFSGVCEYNGVTYVFTLMGSKTLKGRWSDCKKLLNYIYKYC